MSSNRLETWIRANALAIALAFLAPAILWYGLERKDAQLKIELTADIPVVSLQSGLPHGVTITFDGDTVSAVRALEISVINTGDVPVRQSDFDAPIQITLPGRVIAQPVVTTVRPAALAPVISLRDMTVVIQPLLLNSGDSFTFRALLADWTSREIPIRIVGRVSGVSDIEYSDESRRPPASSDDSGGSWFFVILFGAIGVIVLIIEIVRRWRLPGRIEAVKNLRRQLSVTEEQRGRVENLLAELRASTKNEKAMLAEVRDRVELRIRTNGARKLDMSLLTEKDFDDVLGKLERGGVITPDVRKALRLFRGTATDLLASGPRWRTDEDLKNAAAFGVELLVLDTEVTA